MRKEDIYFTPRQRQILQALADGHTSRVAIAAHLGVAPGTIKKHLDMMFQAAGVHRTTALLAAAVRYGWIRPERSEWVSPDGQLTDKHIKNSIL